MVIGCQVLCRFIINNKVGRELPDEKDENRLDRITRGKDIKLDLSPLRKACLSLSEAVTNACDQNFIGTLSDFQRRLMITGVIQNFEFAYELSWNFIKRWLSENVDEWMFYYTARNQTSHSYDEKTAQEIFDASKLFARLAKQLLTALEAQNDGSIG